MRQQSALSESVVNSVGNGTDFIFLQRMYVVGLEKFWNLSNAVVICCIQFNTGIHCPFTPINKQK